MGNQGFPLRGTSLALGRLVHERNNNCFCYISKQTKHVSTNEYRLNRQTCPRIQIVPTLILTSDVVGLELFHLFVGTRCCHSFLSVCFPGVSLPRTLHDGDSRGGRVCLP